ncbi:MAG: alkaline phosphatase family protein [Actinomycetota bacterium]|nr:alkaline phosphatase family protein [Actinomycetota bacterium]
MTQSALAVAPGEISLAQILPSVAAALRVRGYTDVVGLGEPQHVVCCLIDGLGAAQLRQYASTAPVLAAMSGPLAATTIPSTTPVALGSFGIGDLPGAHGIVGASFWVPEFEDVLVPLHWASGIPALAIQPEPTMLELMAAAGIHVTTVAPEAYRNSGLTRAVLRGGSYEAAEDAIQRVRGVLAATATSLRSFTYVYWPQLDRIGHEFGVGSKDWLEALVRVDQLVDALRSALPRNTAMIVTSDHGMINCNTRVAVDVGAEFTDGVWLVAGEPRARHVYAKPGQASQVAARWQEALGDLAQCVEKEELLASGVIGPAIDEIAERLGDVLVFAKADVALTATLDKRVSALTGQHGSISSDEWEIPCLVTQSSGL